VRLVDTSVAVDHLRGEQPATQLLRRLVEEDEVLAASEVTRFELATGARETELSALEQFCSGLSWVPVGEEVARTAGGLASRYRAAHGGIDMADYLIAATSLLLDADLLTTNVRHFPMFPELQAPY
jgi:predicted nucleic acid-binding protein